MDVLLQQSGTYKWSDNWPVMYTNWDKAEPVRPQDGGCVKFNSTGRWSDTSCGNTYAFVCKITQGNIYDLSLWREMLLEQRNNKNSTYCSDQ